MTDPTPSDAPAVLKVSHRVRADQAEAFERTLIGMLKDGEAARGWLSADVVRLGQAEQGEGEWQTVLRFQTEEDLQSWRGSASVTSWRARLHALTMGTVRLERIHGLEVWFSRQSLSDAKPAPKWKMAVVTAIVIYPFILLVPTVLSPVVGEAPMWIRSLLNVAIMVPVMTWGLMPLVTRLLQGWLYPDHPRGQSRDQP